MVLAEIVPASFRDTLILVAGESEVTIHPPQMLLTIMEDPNNSMIITVEIYPAIVPTQFGSIES